MNVLVIGGGGREHALAWKLAQNRDVRRVFATPGNPGIAGEAQCLSVPSSYADLARQSDATLTVVGPEAPLIAGVADELRRENLLVVGPSAAAAQLEGSKSFAKEVMRRAGVPTAQFQLAEDEAAAHRAVAAFGLPVVLKADGLAAGKGVVIAHTPAEAEEAIPRLLDISPQLIVEEFLMGEEVSYIVLSDGSRAVAFDASQDHKTVADGDHGPNTGGMGAYCDGRILSPEQVTTVHQQVMKPMLGQMRDDGIPFTGFLYAGLMMTAQGPRVLEFNVRLGDPETQALLHRLEGDLVAPLLAAARGDVSGHSLRGRPEPSVCVVMAAEGYPGPVRTGDLVTGIEQAEATGAVVFHAGTKRTGEGVVTSGGRVLGVTASGATLEAARQNAYAAVESIQFEGMHYRGDIAAKGLLRWT